MASGKSAKECGHGGHHDGPEAQQAGLIDGFDRRKSLVALGLESKVDHHDGVLFHDADQQDDADERDDAEVGSGEQECKNGSDAGRWQCGENRERMDEAFVQNAEHDVDGDESSEDEVRLVAERILKGLRGSLECSMDCARHTEFSLSLLKSGDGIAQSYVGSQIESEGNGGVLALVVHLERSAA